MKDLAGPGLLSGKVRWPDGGCPTLISKDPTLPENPRQLLESTIMGDPMRPPVWVSKSHAKLVAALRGMGDNPGLAPHKKNKPHIINILWVE